MATLPGQLFVTVSVRPTLVVRDPATLAVNYSRRTAVISPSLKDFSKVISVSRKLVEQTFFPMGDSLATPKIITGGVVSGGVVGIPYIQITSLDGATIYATLYQYGAAQSRKAQLWTVPTGVTAVRFVVAMNGMIPPSGKQIVLTQPKLEFVRPNEAPNPTDFLRGPSAKYDGTV